MYLPYPKKSGYQLLSIPALTPKMIPKLMLGWLLICLFFTSQPSLAKSSSTIQAIPDSIKHQVCRDLSEDKTSCGVDHKVRYIRSIKQNNDQVVMFFYLQDNEPGYHRGVSIPVKLNADGQWITGSSFVGEPRLVILDIRGGLWMHAQFSSTGNTPRLLYSQHGLDWLEIKLPETNANKNITQFENISKLCFQGGTLVMSLQSTGSENKHTLTSWRSNLSKLKAKQPMQVQPWEEITNKVANSHTCKKYKAKNNDWLIQGGETLTLLQHEKKNLTIKVMHESKTAPTVASSTKPFAIQIGAYSNHAFVDQLVKSIQKQGFQTFTKLIDSSTGKTTRETTRETNSSDRKIKKLYIGPYQNREITIAKLVELKNKMNGNKTIQSAFVLKF